ncbi:hypothetical protein [Brevundimonas olei]|uniref:hypothetical protein n=1 Tax=Brevundimonas olei TaxID=657642 RepID=UPI0031DD1F6F
MAEDFDIKATYPHAAELIHETNLNAADAEAVAAALFAENNAPALAFRVQYEGTASLDDLTFGPIAVQVDSPRYQTDSRVLKSAELIIDPFLNRTEMVVRG